MENGAEHDWEQRQYPQRYEVAVSQCDDSAHDQAGKGYDPVLCSIGACLRSVSEPCDYVKDTVYCEGNQYPELNVSVKGLSEIISQAVVNADTYFKGKTHKCSHENYLLKFKPYRSFQTPHRGIFGLLGVHF